MSSLIFLKHMIDLSSNFKTYVPHTINVGTTSNEICLREILGHT